MPEEKDFEVQEYLKEPEKNGPTGEEAWKHVEWRLGVNLPYVSNCRTTGIIDDIIHD